MVEQDKVIMQNIVNSYRESVVQVNKVQDQKIDCEFESILFYWGDFHSLVPGIEGP